MSKEPNPPSDIEDKEDEEDEEVLETEEEPVDKLGALKSQLAKLEEEVRNLNDEMLRIRADTENFRKRLRKEKEEALHFANKNFIKEILPISENLDRALSAENASVDGLKEGVEMISKQFHSFLEKARVEPIPAKGEKFDPSLHEVLSQMESDDHEENTILEEYSRGYLLNGKVLVPAKVVICKKPENKESPDEKEDQDDEGASDKKSASGDASIDEPPEEAEVPS